MARKTVSDDFMIFPQRLSELMKERKLTQQNLADGLGVKRQTVSLYMSGQSMPDAEQLRNIALFFDVSSDWLLGLSNFKKIENQAELASELGLTEKAIGCLRWIKNDEDHNELVFTINTLLEDIKDCFCDCTWQDSPVLLSISNYLHSESDDEDDKFYVGRNGKLYKHPDLSLCNHFSDVIHVSDLVRNAYLKEVEERLFRIWLDTKYGK